MITQCLSLAPPNEFRIKSAEIIRKNKSSSNLSIENEFKNGLNLNDDDKPKRKLSSKHNLSGTF